MTMTSSDRAAVNPVLGAAFDLNTDKKSRSFEYNTRSSEAGPSSDGSSPGKVNSAKPTTSARVDRDAAYSLDQPNDRNGTSDDDDEDTSEDVHLSLRKKPFNQTPLFLPEESSTASSPRLAQHGQDRYQLPATVAATQSLETTTPRPDSPTQDPNELPTASVRDADAGEQKDSPGSPDLPAAFAIAHASPSSSGPPVAGPVIGEIVPPSTPDRSQTSRRHFSPRASLVPDTPLSPSATAAARSPHALGPSPAGSLRPSPQGGFFANMFDDVTNSGCSVDSVARQAVELVDRDLNGTGITPDNVGHSAVRGRASLPFGWDGGSPSKAKVGNAPSPLKAVNMATFTIPVSPEAGLRGMGGVGRMAAPPRVERGGVSTSGGRGEREVQKTPEPAIRSARHSTSDGPETPRAASESASPAVVVQVLRSSPKRGVAQPPAQEEDADRATEESEREEQDGSSSDDVFEWPPSMLTQAAQPEVEASAVHAAPDRAAEAAASASPKLDTLPLDPGAEQAGLPEVVSSPASPAASEPVAQQIAVAVPEEPVMEDGPAPHATMQVSAGLEDDDEQANVAKPSDEPAAVATAESPLTLNTTVSSGSDEKDPSVPRPAAPTPPKASIQPFDTGHRPARPRLTNSPLAAGSFYQPTPPGPVKPSLPSSAAPASGLMRRRSSGRHPPQPAIAPAGRTPVVTPTGLPRDMPHYLRSAPVQMVSAEREVAEHAGVRGAARASSVAPARRESLPSLGGRMIGRRTSGPGTFLGVVFTRPIARASGGAEGTGSVRRQLPAKAYRSAPERPTTERTAPVPVDATAPAERVQSSSPPPLSSRLASAERELTGARGVEEAAASIETLHTLAADRSSPDPLGFDIGQDEQDSDAGEAIPFDEPAPELDALLGTLPDVEVSPDSTQQTLSPVPSPLSVQSVVPSPAPPPVMTRPARRRSTRVATVVEFDDGDNTSPPPLPPRVKRGRPSAVVAESSPASLASEVSGVGLSARKGGRPSRRSIRQAGYAVGDTEGADDSSSVMGGHEDGVPQPGRERGTVAGEAVQADPAPPQDADEGSERELPLPKKRKRGRPSKSQPEPEPEPEPMSAPEAESETEAAPSDVEMSSPPVRGGVRRKVHRTPTAAEPDAVATPAPTRSTRRGRRSQSTASADATPTAAGLASSRPKRQPRPTTQWWHIENALESLEAAKPRKRQRLSEPGGRQAASSPASSVVRQGSRTRTPTWRAAEAAAANQARGLSAGRGKGRGSSARRVRIKEVTPEPSEESEAEGETDAGQEGDDEEVESGVASSATEREPSPPPPPPKRRKAAPARKPQPGPKLKFGLARTGPTVFAGGAGPAWAEGDGWEGLPEVGGIDDFSD